MLGDMVMEEHLVWCLRANRVTQPAIVEVRWMGNEIWAQRSNLDMLGIHSASALNYLSSPEVFFFF